jgi:CheY-like chemotaxis protein
MGSALSAASSQGARQIAEPWAADGAEALDLLRSSAQPRPGLIILDLGMPNMDGHQFREQQGHDPGLSSIPTIIVTSARRADIRGAAVLSKPLDLVPLSETIRTLTGSGAQ